MKVQPSIITKTVTDIKSGDVLVGEYGGHSVVEYVSNRSGLLGFLRIKTEHGHLYLDMSQEVRVLPNPEKE